MEGIKWIKIVTDIFDDDKILLIESMPDADSIIVIWFKLLCLAGKQNNSGVFLINERIPYTDEMFSTIFRRPLNTVRLALKTFEEFGMIEIVNNAVTIPKWEKHQRLDALEASREATKKRVAKFRKKQKQLADGGNVTERYTVTDCNAVTVTACNADRIDIDTAIEIDKEIDKNTDTEQKKKTRAKKRNTFVPPTVEQIAEYIQEKGYQVDAQYFFDHYESIGWMVGQSKMVSWKATVRTWESRNKQFNKEKQRPNQTTNTQRSKDSFDVNKNDEPGRVGSGTVI